MLNRIRSLFLGLCLAPTFVLATSSAPGDLPGSHDHPIVSRFAGSRIIGYQQVAFDEAAFPLGPYKSSAPDRFARSESLQGKITRIAYEAPSDKSTLEVFSNFAQALGAAGFSTRFSCARTDCGNAADFSDAVIRPLLDPMKARNAMVQTLYAIDGDARALTAHLDRPAGAVDVALLVSHHDKQPVGVLLQVVEAKPMATDQVTVDAKAMSDGLAQAGHIALYGIHFASDSAVLEKASDATLEQMAHLLKAQPALKVYIVGHTDNSGSLAHNTTLSRQRAAAVAEALSTRYGIAPQRMAARGLASYAPVASNRDDTGKAKNRRVELVEQ